MVKLDRDKFFDAIFAYLAESISIEKATLQANTMTDDLFTMYEKISTSMEDPTFKDFETLVGQFHTLKNLLLHGDFYYESDLCQDIEIDLRKNKDISNIKSLFGELVESLKR